MNKRDLLTDLDLKNIYSKMIDYLARGSMSEKRLVARINRLRLRYPDSARYKNYTTATAWKVIPLLREEGVINEQQHAENLFNQLKDKKDGIRAIRRKMLTRQIKKEVADDILTKFTQAEQKQNLTKITQLAKEKMQRLQEKYGHDPIKKYQIKSKLYAWLSMRGFDLDEIHRITDALP